MKWDSGVRVLNSLRPPRSSSSSSSSSLVPLLLHRPNQCTWYQCGPTVYDVAHLGHARSYVSLDILQRVLSDAMHIRLHAAMNVTDVDDKLVNRALEQSCSVEELAKRYERAFNDDMRRLCVRRPAYVARVSEYIDEIVQFIQLLLDNGAAYVGKRSGSIYFSTRSHLRAFPQRPRLDPSRCARALATDVDGGDYDGDSDEISGEKVDPSDFALWKCIDEQREPRGCWSSPFGRGRPGWHTECSTMARHLFGRELDVHAGGMDLKFPHHENEIMQCEAANGGGDGDDWPLCFLHVGHLHIKGSKMSKSLKNFVSIDDWLDSVNSSDAASLWRWFCLLHRYWSVVDWNDDRIDDARRFSARFDRFYESIDRLVDDSMTGSRCGVVDEETRRLAAACDDAVAAVDLSLRANFDTVAALNSLLQLISNVNAYCMQRSVEKVHLGVVLDAYRVVRRTLSSFGLDARRPKQQEDTSSDSTELNSNLLLRSGIADVREYLRREALQSPVVSSANVLAVCDRIRDELLKNNETHSIRDKKIS